MTVAALPDLEILDALDWQHEPPCECPRCAGTNGPATHRIVPLTCPCPPVLCCTPCAESVKRQFDVLLRRPICRRCYLIRPPSLIRDLYRLEPL